MSPVDEAWEVAGKRLREREEARAELASERRRHAEMEREMLNRGAIVFAAQQAETDKARAIARRLAADVRWYDENLGIGETPRPSLAAFDALPWAKDDA